MRRGVRAALITGAGAITIAVLSNVISTAVERAVLPTPEPAPTQPASPPPPATATFGPPGSPLTLSSAVGMPLFISPDGLPYAPVEYLLRNTSTQAVTVSGIEQDGRVCFPGLAQHAVVPAGGTLPVVVSVPGWESTAHATSLRVVVDSEVVTVTAPATPASADELNWAAAESEFAQLLDECDPNLPSTPAGDTTATGV